VNAEEAEGKMCLREWGKAPHKVILNYTWVQACLEHGHALLQDEYWGGHRVVDDGAEIAEEDGDDGHAK